MILLEDSGKITHISILVIGAPHTGKTTLCNTLISGTSPKKSKKTSTYFGPYLPSIESSFTVQITSPMGQTFETRDHGIPFSYLPNEKRSQGSTASQPKVNGIHQRQTVVTHIIDAGGTQNLSEMWASQIVAADAFLLVYDVGDKTSLQHLWKFYRLIAEIKNLPLHYIPVVIVGNMIDTVSSDSNLTTSSSAASHSHHHIHTRERQVTQDMIHNLSDMIRVPFVETTSRAPSSVLFCFRQLISESQRIIRKRLMETPDIFDLSTEFSNQNQNNNGKTMEETPGAAKKESNALSYSNSMKSSCRSSFSSSYHGSSRFSVASRTFFQGSVNRVKNAVDRMSSMANLRRSSPPSSLSFHTPVDEKNSASEINDPYAGSNMTRSQSLGGNMKTKSRSLRTVMPIAGLWSPLTSSTNQHMAENSGAPGLLPSPRNSCISQITTSTQSSSGTSARPLSFQLENTCPVIAPSLPDILAAPLPGSIRYRRDMACRIWRDRMRKCSNESFEEPRVGLKHLMNAEGTTPINATTTSMVSDPQTKNGESSALPNRVASLGIRSFQAKTVATDPFKLSHQTHLSVARRQIQELLEEIQAFELPPT